jgi:hypothetical protein
MVEVIAPQFKGAEERVDGADSVAVEAFGGGGHCIVGE